MVDTFQTQAAFVGSADSSAMGRNVALREPGPRQSDGAGLVSVGSDVRTAHGRHFVLALVGLAFEARIAAGPQVLVFCNDRGRDVSDILDRAARSGCRSVISFGIAGGLAPNLRAGDWIVASAVMDAQHIRLTDPAWTRRLMEAVPGAWYAPILGVDAPIVEPAAKLALHRELGAAAVDMESHVVARLAHKHGLAFAAVRVIVDPAHRTVPQAALVGMRVDGRTDLTAVLRELMLRPGQTGALLRIAVDAVLAISALVRIRELLGPAFGYLDMS